MERRGKVSTSADTQLGNGQELNVNVAEQAREEAEFASWLEVNKDRLGLDQISLGDQRRMFERARLVEQITKRKNGDSSEKK